MTGVRLVRRFLVFTCVLLLFAAGFACGAATLMLWQRWGDSLPGRRIEATVLIPLVDNSDLPLPTEKWHAALEPLVARFGGATLGPQAEGCWRDQQGKLRREPVRPLVVSFETARLAEFRESVHELGRRLGQDAVYVRFDEPRIEVLAVQPGR